LSKFVTICIYRERRRRDRETDKWHTGRTEVGDEAEEMAGSQDHFYRMDEDK
jgi:hypothetical protein